MTKLKVYDIAFLMELVDDAIARVEGDGKPWHDTEHHAQSVKQRKEILVDLRKRLFDEYESRTGEIYG